DVQDIEFTVEEGKLYFLQTRPAKRTPLAAIHFAVAFVHEGLIDQNTALSRLAEIDLDHIGELRFKGTATAVATAISASPGVASGRVAFESTRVKVLAAQGEPVVLVRPEVSTDDIAGLASAVGILTAIGGRTAHAAVVARQIAFDNHQSNCCGANHSLCGCARELATGGPFRHGPRAAPCR